MYQMDGLRADPSRIGGGRYALPWKPDEIQRQNEYIKLLQSLLDMTAGANKFLWIYYGRVKEYLLSLPESE
jgi:hypothetical protein